MNKVKSIALTLILILAVAIGSPASAYANAPQPVSVTDAYKASNSGTGRLSVSDKRLFVSAKGKLTVTLADRKDGEDVEVKVSDKSFAKVVKGKWNGDTLGVTVKAKKPGSVTLTITSGKDKVKVNVVIKDGSRKTSEEIYSDAESAMVEFDCFDKVGTEYIGAGFFIGDRRILTNYHVIEAAAKMTVSNYNGRKLTPTRILAYNANSDLAVVEVKEKNKNALVITSDAVTTGDTIYTIGSPYGYTGTFSKGIVSLAKRKMDGYNYIQITAATSQGSGGGPLLNENGEVVGVNTLTVRAAQNLNFALKINYLKDLNYNAPITIEDFLKGTGDKTYTSVVLYNSEKRTSPGIGVLRVDDIKGEKEQELTPQEICELTRGGMVEIKNATTTKGDATGSGFFIAEDIVMTNYHVIENAAALRVMDYEKNEYKVLGLEGWDSKKDIAILKVENSAEHKTVQIDAAYLPATGETIYTFGSPYWYTETFSQGIVSMTESHMDGIDYTQIEAPISSGNSGGPLINKYGRAIGINTASYLSSQNINFSLKLKYMYELSHTTFNPIEEYYSANIKKADVKG